MRNFVFQLTICLTIFLTFQTIAHAAGVIDRSFGTNGTATTSMNIQPQTKVVLTQPDGKIIVIGDAAPTVGAKRDVAYARYNADGTLDTTFGFGGRAFVSISSDNDVVNAATLQPDGKIVIVGSMEPTPGSTNTNFLVIRVNSNGSSLDSQFGNLGFVTVNQGSFDTFNAVTVQSDGKIVAVGRTSDGDRAAALRFNTNGTLDTSFANGGLFYWKYDNIVRNTVFRDVKMFPNGRILIGGGDTSADPIGATDIFMLLEPNGTFVQDFGTNLGFLREYLSYQSQNLKLAILPNGKYLAISDLSFRRYFSNGALDQSFRTLYSHSCCIVTYVGTDFAVRSDGRIIVLNQGSPFYPGVNTVVYDNNGREINRVKLLSGSKIAVQNDDRFLIINSSGDNFTLTRFNSISSPGTRIADFDYDGKTDLIFSRAINNTAYVLRSSQSVASYQTNGRIIPEDYYSDNANQFPLFYWRNSGQNNPAYFNGVTESGNAVTYQWGTAGDIPIGGDYDGETQGFNGLFRKSTELAIFRPSDGNWWIFNRSNNTSFAYHWGANGDKPVPADYDYDGITDYAIYRPSTGTWWIHRSADDSFFTLQFGVASDIPLTGDFDGDGKADFTVYRPSEGTWYQYLTSAGFRVTQFGLATDIPVPGDYDGDGKHDIAVYRNGFWYLLQSTEGSTVVQWGTATDNPISVRYDQ